VGTLHPGYSNTAEKTSLQPNDRLARTSLAPPGVAHKYNLRTTARLGPHSSDLMGRTLPRDSPDQGRPHEFKACQKAMSSFPLAPSIPRLGRWVYAIIRGIPINTHEMCHDEIWHRVLIRGFTTGADKDARGATGHDSE
jgi:hypothetical protein